ncbi:MAG: YqeG family HAD IIIA-type phosphatase [Armatimonadetes bacterium]|nr:YqeG family HAD IIIA-type phosphatase [Armatimonadota bacterium]
MRHFRQGTFSRKDMPGLIRPFSPSESLNNLEDVDLAALYATGKRLVLLDVDNTLLPWKSEEIPDSTKRWIEGGKAAGLRFTVLSNTHNPARLERLCKAMGIEFIRDRAKPSRRMFLLAMQKEGVEPAQAVMVGDQLMTDVWGANRCGIDAIWVKPIHPKEFIGTTVVSRKIEWLLGHFLYRYFQGDGADEESRPGFFGRQIVRQILKFGVVGGVALVVDTGIFYYLMFVATVGDRSLKEVAGTWALKNLPWEHGGHDLQEAAYVPLKVVPVLVAILVSYILNRIWTFQATHEKATISQAVKFYVIALIGAFIATVVGSLVQRVVPLSERPAWAVAQMAGIIAGFIWNFNGQRLWTFRHK